MKEQKGTKRFQKRFQSLQNSFKHLAGLSQSSWMKKCLSRTFWSDSYSHCYSYDWGCWHCVMYVLRKYGVCFAIMWWWNGYMDAVRLTELYCWQWKELYCYVWNWPWLPFSSSHFKMLVHMWNYGSPEGQAKIIFSLFKSPFHSVSTLNKHFLTSVFEKNIRQNFFLFFHTSIKAKWKKNNKKHLEIFFSDFRFCLFVFHVKSIQWFIFFKYSGENKIFF